MNVAPSAYYWHGNQPDLYSVYLFNAAGRPDLTRKWVHWILDHKYGDDENGLDGNDDGGTLSAWYVLSSLGIFPTAGSERSELVSPLWFRADVQAGDSRLSITGHGPSTAAERVRVNGSVVDRTWIAYPDIARGGLIAFETVPATSQSRTLR